MIFRDVLGISSGNLWRMKLRTILTTAGIVIAIAALVSMMSFGAGMQENVTDRFNDLGLLSTMSGGIRKDDLVVFAMSYT